MGTQNVDRGIEGEQLRAFTQALLTDLRALERMLDEGLIEADQMRIGAEQEMFLVDRAWRPAPLAPEVLELIEDDRFTTELARFNMEANLDPLPMGGDCLTQMEWGLTRIVDTARRAAEKVGARVVLTGILPTLEKSHLGLENMTPKPRYFALNDAISRLRSGAWEFRIKGADELNIKHDSVMVEACNTSFQVHFQVSPEKFARKYNVAQAVAGPVLAAAVNSPLLFGRRLWRETRIAVFEQSVDTRDASMHRRRINARVSFGEDWVADSVLDIIKQDVAQFRTLLAANVDEDSVALLDKGITPKLQAFQLHNSTIYRWNRPCYGVTDGKPHLRIENRLFPSGPTVADEVANAAFWFGLMQGLADEVGDVREVMQFEEAKENFLGAARLGLDAQLSWMGRPAIPARALIMEELLPLAERGLQSRGVDRGDVERFLRIIEQRVDSGQTGAAWMLRSLGSLKETHTEGERLCAITAGMYSRQLEDKPVHTWTLAEAAESGDWLDHYDRVERYMTTELFTVHEDELLHLVANLMDWKHIRHVPVEDNDHRLVGLVSHRAILRHFAKQLREGDGKPVAVKEIMHASPLAVAPDTPTLEAVRLMRDHKVGCLPVVDDGRLVGIVTERDFMNIAAALLEERLGQQRLDEIE